MDIDEIKSILNNRIAFNERERSAALNRGDLDAVARIDADTAKTQATISLLNGISAQ